MVFYCVASWETLSPESPEVPVKHSAAWAAPLEAQIPRHLVWGMEIHNFKLYSWLSVSMGSTFMASVNHWSKIFEKENLGSVINMHRPSFLVTIPWRMLHSNYLDSIYIVLGIISIVEMIESPRKGKHQLHTKTVILYKVLDQPRVLISASTLEPISLALGTRYREITVQTIELVNNSGIKRILFPILKGVLTPYWAHFWIHILYSVYHVHPEF